MSDKKMKRDDLGYRMKTFYEEIPKTKLMRRCPVFVSEQEAQDAKQSLDYGEGMFEWQ